MISSEYSDHLDNLLMLMQRAIDSTCCDSHISITDLTKIIKNFKADFKIYQKLIKKWKLNAEINPEALEQLEIKLETVKILLSQLEAELKMLNWEKENPNNKSNDL